MKLIRTKQPEYRVWQSMKDRCRNPRAQAWARYGGRGIWVDLRWLDYATFIADMGRRPGPDHQLERLNNNMGYSKGNCAWVTRKMQMRNQRRTKFSMEIANTIRAEYAAGGVFQEDLAKKYKTNQAHISGIIRKVRWA